MKTWSAIAMECAYCRLWLVPLLTAASATAMANSEDVTKTGGGTTVVASVGGDIAAGRPHHLMPLINLEPYVGGGAVRLHDVYTRLYLRPVVQQAQGGGESPRDYDRERRSLLRRALMSSEVSRVMSVKLQVRNPDIVANATLASATYSGGLKKGESWATEVNRTQYVTPYIRVDNNSVLRMEASMQASARTSDQLSRSMLSLVSGAVGMIAPVGSMVNALNSDRINRAAEFSENAIAGLMSDELSERTAHEVPITTWRCGPLARITGYFPQQGSITIRDARIVGSWDVVVDEPVISVFNPVIYPLGKCSTDNKDRDLVVSTNATLDSSKRSPDSENVLPPTPVLLAARTAVKELMPSDVLHFRLGENTDVYKELVSDQAIAAAMSEMARIKVDGKSRLPSEDEAQSAYNMCSLIARKSSELGFNRVDAAAVYWAYTFSPALSKRNGELLRDSTCAIGGLMRDMFDLTRIKWEAVKGDQVDAPVQLMLPLTPPSTPPSG